MSEPILYFSGQYRFLSNFYLARVSLDRLEYPTVEHAYQAAKSDNPTYREKIRLNPSAGHAKSSGRKAVLIPNWDTYKLFIMKELLIQKFVTGKDAKELGEKLVATGKSHLVEGNTWKDTYWGECPIGT